MQPLFLVAVLQVFALGPVRGQMKEDKSIVGHAKIVLTSAAEAVSDTLNKVPPIRDIIFPDCIEPEQECPNKNITFWYYTRETQDNPMLLYATDHTSLRSISKNQNPWKIIIHGYTKSKDEIPNPQLRSAYFKHGDYNIISVDYKPITPDGCYMQSVHNAPLIANCTAQLIDALIDLEFFKSKDIHIIGFSLGAQVAGLLASHMQHSRPHRVTALDPASPLFDGNINHKINKYAAEFVDVIHTNALIKGLLDPVGHADFYVNGGYNQPGCILNNNGSINSCSHDRSTAYFAESINTVDGFWGIPCENAIKFFARGCDTHESKLVLMGEWVPQNVTGRFYLQTTDTAPFALGKTTKALIVL